MPVDFCNWCPDPQHPNPAFHPGGQARHEPTHFLVVCPSCGKLFPLVAEHIVTTGYLDDPPEAWLSCPKCGYRDLIHE
jgi:DNA-directed RNA polymerase subunit RPC12/RpoP